MADVEIARHESVSAVVMHNRGSEIKEKIVLIRFAKGLVLELLLPC